ncbi:MAG TPA: hypothetical protein VHA52_01250, partial [Candidatus Babeliaceae bacterium]|nr:hypothetical protein [Candidatus Babeliaceae bacterium]
ISLLCITRIHADGPKFIAGVIGNSADFSLTNPEGKNKICLKNTPLLRTNPIKFIVNDTDTVFSHIEFTYIAEGTCPPSEIPSSNIQARSVIQVDVSCSESPISSITLFQQFENSELVIAPPGQVLLAGSKDELKQSLTILITQDSDGTYHVKVVDSDDTTIIRANS